MLVSLPLDAVEDAISVPFEHAFGGAILLTAVVATTPVVWMVVHRIYGGRNVFFARWGFFHLLQVLLLGVLLSLALAQFLPGTLASEETQIGTLLAWQCVVFGPPCALVLLFARRLDPDGVRCLGLRVSRLGRALAAGLLAYVAFLPGFYALMLVWPYLLERFGASYEPQPFQDMFLSASGFEFWSGVALAVLVLPFFEELLFRAFLQPLLVQNFRDAGGVVLTALIFAALHGQGAFLPIFGLALLLGFLMLRTQRLLAVWSVHALHNGLQVALALSVAKLDLSTDPGLLLMNYLR